MNPVLEGQVPAAVSRTITTPAHALGPVADDWEAAEVWLRAVARKSKNGSRETVTTYRYHLAKLRWYCENIMHTPPSRWSMQDADAFAQFLSSLPLDAWCARVGRRFAKQDEPGYTPFRGQPAPGSQSDIRRFVHALFQAWQRMGYIGINPMAMEGTGTRRRVNVHRALDEDLFEMVLDALATEEVKDFAARQKNLRDRFALLALRELGLRASELVNARMNAFYQLLDPRNGKSYWVFLVSAETGKGGKRRHIPVTRRLLQALVDYRRAFGFAPLPVQSETGALLLSPRTGSVAIAHRLVTSPADRRYFGAWQEVRSRHGLYQIVKQRMEHTATRLRQAGRNDEAVHLNNTTPHWLRHTFAHSVLRQGHGLREVASLLGHASTATTMIYTEQDALDLIRAMERNQQEALTQV